MAINVTISFGGDRQTVTVNSFADLSSERVSRFLGYDPRNVEFVRQADGRVLTASDHLNDGSVITVRTKANTKGAVVRVSFGGDTREVAAGTVGDLRHDSVARDFGYNPANVTFVVNGVEKADSYQLFGTETIVVRTKANTKG